MKSIKFKASTLVLAAGLVGALSFTKIQQFQAMAAAGAAFQMPPAVVTSVEVARAEWDNSLYALGELEAENGVLLAADLAGRVVSIQVTSGQTVNKGDIILELDTLNEKAQLTAAKADARAAAKSAKRARSLIKTKDISPEQYDQRIANAEQTQAQVANIEETIRKKTIRAPFSGTLGILQADLGQFLGAGDPIISLQNTDSLLVNFTLPQRYRGQVTLGQSVKLRAREGNATQSSVLQGTLTAISPTIDAATRNIRLQARLPENTDQWIAGMSVDVDVIMPESSQVMMVPATAVLYAPYGNSVYIIEGDAKKGQTIRQQFVRLGQRRGDFIAIEKGVDVGQEVVSTGLFKLFNGQKIVVDNKLSPDFQLNPSVTDA